MLKTLGLILAIIVAVLLTIVVCLGSFALFCAALFTAWNALHRLFFPARDNLACVNQTLLRDIPYFHRFQQEHTAEPVLSLTALPDGFWIASTARDKKLRVWDGEWNNVTTASLPFYPGPLVVGDHENNGLRVAVGVAKQSQDDAPGVLVWEPMVSSDVSPRFTLVLPGLRVVHALAWDDTAETLRVFAGVFDPSRRAAFSQNTEEPNAFKWFQWDLQTVNGSDQSALPPRELPLPPEFDHLSPWEYAKQESIALSANGLYLACRTEYADPHGTGGFGVGVWDGNKGVWHRRFGGREAYPHDIWALSRSGDTVYSTRQDGPGRDQRNGGQEWYDGLYIWEAHTAPPEGQKEAVPFSSLSGSKQMVFNRDETRMANPTGPTGDVAVYDMQTKTRLQKVTRPAPKNEKNQFGHTVWCCAFCDNSRELVTGHADGQLWWWGVLPNDGKRVNENQ